MTDPKILYFSLLIALWGSPALYAQSGPRLAVRNGAVEVLRNNQWVPLMPGEAVNSGEKIRTGSDSSASIELDSGQVITLSSNSEVQLADTNKHTYVAGGGRLLPPVSAICPNNYFYPYVIYGNLGVQAQPFAGYAPSQVIPPMTDPLRPPVHYPVNPFPVR